MSESFIIPDETVISKIYQFRGAKVMVDSDLAELYGICKTGKTTKKRDWF